MALSTRSILRSHRLACAAKQFESVSKTKFKQVWTWLEAFFLRKLILLTLEKEEPGL